MGSILAISISNSTDGVPTVVDFFGPSIQYLDIDLPDSVTKNFLPLLILEGENDSIVPVSNAYALQEAVLSNGGEVEMYTYPNAGHGFNLRVLPGFSEAATKDANNKAMLFLN